MLTNDTLAMPHMPATGVSGIDLYCRPPGETQWRWLSIARPRENPYFAELLTNIDPADREYLMYLPLYNGMRSLEIGTSHNAAFTSSPAPKRRVVYYGTSIAQGGCASRPGMAHVAILGRQLDVEMINLGFSGQARLDLPIADAMSEIDAAVYVVDCLPNCSTEIVQERGEAFLRRLHAARPTTPIVVVGDPDWCHAFASSPTRAAQQPRRLAMQQACDRASAADVKCSWHPIDNAFAPDYEGTVDGVHPNDLGMSQLARAIAPAIERALGKAAGR
jgi:lysophospholipase L1-like esterase